MNSKIKKAKKPAKGKVYPYLGEHLDGTIILFLKEDEGVVVYAGQYSGNYIGECGGLGVGCWRESEFKKSKKEVILSND